MNFLVVDDMKFDRNLIELGIKKLGFSVTTAENEEEMFAACRKAMPDCILLNWEMGVTTGIVLLKRLREMEGGCDAKVVICTSNSHPSFVGHAYAQGADSFISKPLTMEKLTQKLQEINLL